MNTNDQHTIRRRASLAWAIIAAAGALTKPALAMTQPAPATAVKSDLIGVWSFEGRSRCKTGDAWMLRPDGSYSEISLPNRTSRGSGKWYERRGTIFYSLARPERLPSGPLNKRMVIVERSPDRVVALTRGRIRHVMHRCS